MLVTVQTAIDAAKIFFDSEQDRLDGRLKWRTTTLAARPAAKNLDREVGRPNVRPTLKRAATLAVQIFGREVGRQNQRRWNLRSDHNLKNVKDLPKVLFYKKMLNLKKK